MFRWFLSMAAWVGMMGSWPDCAVRKRVEGLAVERILETRRAGGMRRAEGKVSTADFELIYISMSSASDVVNVLFRSEFFTKRVLQYSKSTSNYLVPKPSKR